MGPYQVIRMIGSAAVKLQLPGHMRCHNVFHVSLVKPYKIHEGEVPHHSIPLISFDSDGTPIWQLERIINCRPIVHQEGPEIRIQSQVA